MKLRSVIIAAFLCCVAVTGANSFWQSRLQISAGVSCTFSTIDFTTGSLGAAALSRASSGTYINVSGVLTTATTNAARFNYDSNYPAGNAAPSLTGPFLLVEPAATNILTQSNNFNNAAWSSTGTTLVSGVFTSPDGTTDGWTMASTTFSGISQFPNQTTQSYALSIWAKSVVGNNMFFQIGSIAPVNVVTSATLIRYSQTKAVTAGSGLTNQYGLDDNPGTKQIFGAQLEAGAVATSYIVTTTVTASRSPDVVTFTQPAGCGHNTYTFDDNSTQTVTQAAGTATVPTNLNRPNIKSIAGST